MHKSRQKGKSYERKIAQLLTTHLKTTFKPTPGSGSIGTNAGISGLQGDIIRTDLKPIIYIECKKYKDFRLENFLLQQGNEWDWVTQTLKAIGNNTRLWCIIFQKDYGRQHWCLTNVDVPIYPRYELHVDDTTKYILADFLKMLKYPEFKSQFGEEA